MIRLRRLDLVTGSLLVTFLCAGVVSAQDRPAPLATTRELPNAFGTSAYTVTTISATAFFPGNSAYGYATTGSLGRFVDPSGFQTPGRFEIQERLSRTTSGARGATGAGNGGLAGDIQVGKPTKAFFD